MKTKQRCSSETKIDNPGKRKKGQGTGSCQYHYKKVDGINKYKQLWFHYEIWKDGVCLGKKSKYVPQRLENQILLLNEQKASVADILKALSPP